MTTHTATPWAWHKGDDEREVTGSVYSETRKGHAYAVAMQPRYVSHEQWQNDASHIVRCVNAHDELVAALRDLLSVAQPAFRSKPMGQEGSPARLQQATHIAVEDRARAVLAKVQP